MKPIDRAGADHMEPLPFEVASYSEQSLSCYAGNPFIEALPRIRSQEEVFELLAHELPFSPADRKRSREERIHLIANIPSFCEPLPMGPVIFERMDRMIRLSYRERNPVSPEFVRRSAGRDAGRHLGAPTVRPGAFNSATSMTVIGTSGMGKTTAITTALALFPQVIAHSEYRGRALSLKQLVWLKLDCPHDGSLRGLLMDMVVQFDVLLGTNYERHYLRSRPTVDRLIQVTRQLAALHGLGLLVIDEVQNLSRANSGGEDRMLNFFVQFINTVGVAVVLVGTPGATPILTKEFRMARRGTGQGDLVWRTMADKGDENHHEAPNEREILRNFLNSLWQYQYVRNPVDLSDELVATLHVESLGITDLVVKLFVFAQQHAIDGGSERITPELIRFTAAEDLGLMRNMLQALRQQDLPYLERLDDVLPGVPQGASLPPETPTGVPGRPISQPHTPADSNQAGGVDPTGNSARLRKDDGDTRPGHETLTLSEIVEDGKRESQTAHEALLSVGLARDLAAEIQTPLLPEGAE